MKKYLLRIRAHLFLQFLFIIISTISEAMIPLIHREVFDQNDRFSFSLPFLIFANIFLYIIFCTFSYLHSIQLWKVGIKIEKHMKEDFFRSIANMKYCKFAKKDIGEYISMQNNEISIIETDYLTPMQDLINSIFILLIYGIVLFAFVDFRIALTILISSIASVYMANLTAIPLSKKRMIYTDYLAIYTTKVKDFLDGKKSITSKTTPAILTEHNKTLDNLLEKRYSYGKFKSFSLAFNGFITLNISVVTFAVVAYLLYADEITVGTAVATMGYVGAFLSPIQSIVYDVNAIQSVKGVKDKVINFLMQSNEYPLTDLAEFKRTIRFESVSISHSRFTIKDLSLTLEKGKKYALIGHNGSGKSTLMNLFMKFYESEEGAIYVDNNDISKFDISKIVCLISQNEHIFNTGFHDNVTIFNTFPFPSKNTYNFIKGDKYNKISEQESSAKLSGGEKQILAVLRMLAAGCEICIMDEPFSAMDQITAKIVQSSLMQLEDKTIIIITHDISDNLELFDEIILMEDGKIIKKGTYEDIVQLDSYKKLISSY